VTVYEGDYDYYLFKRGAIESAAAANEAAGTVAVQAAVPLQARKDRERKRREAEARNRAYRLAKDRMARLGEVDRELAGLHERHDDLLAALSDQSTYADRDAFSAAMDEYPQVKARIGELESEWLRLAEEVEEITSTGEE
jgi:ATP-binding cassette subfamily F protein 3